MTFPSTLRAARPAVWVSERVERRKPSLSASRIATRDTSGKSSPSLNRLTPINTSMIPLRRFSRIFTRSIVSTSEWIYWHLIPIRSRYLLSSSAILFVRVVTNVRSRRSMRCWISFTRWSIWFLLGTISITGSGIPVGRIICSTMMPSLFSSS